MKRVGEMYLHKVAKDHAEVAGFESGFTTSPET